MIRQEKRKRRWLEKNGFTLVTEENIEQLIELSRELDNHIGPPGGYYAYTTHQCWGWTQLYLVNASLIKRELHEIKLDYIVSQEGQRPVSKAVKLARKLKTIRSQWAALIKHGVNPWW